MDVKELKERQSWSLDQKIDHSLGVIDQFYNRTGGGCYVSFSGGKDSTIVLWLARKIYPNIKAAFCNTGNEYPDIVRFVRTIDNVDWITPKLKPDEVLGKYGFPLLSKETSSLIYDIRKNPKSVRSLRGLGITKNLKYTTTVPLKYRFLIDEKFTTGSLCCSKLKKEPMHKYESDNNVSPILGVMACESRLRAFMYIRQGSCNTFNENGRRSKSMPLSIWLEDDVWNCIKKYKIPIAEIYNKGAQRTGCMFCGYGCQFADDNRLQLVYSLYPKWYEKFMNYTNNGVTYREALRKVLSINGLCLPDENLQLKLFEL